MAALRVSCEMWGKTMTKTTDKIKTICKLSTTIMPHMTANTINKNTHFQCYCKEVVNTLEKLYHNQVCEPKKQKWLVQLFSIVENKSVIGLLTVLKPYLHFVLVCVIQCNLYKWHVKSSQYQIKWFLLTYLRRVREYNVFCTAIHCCH